MPQPRSDLRRARLRDTVIQARAYWASAPGIGELREAPLDVAPAPGTSLIRAAFSGVSPGTERLVGLARVPDGAPQAMRCPYMEGTFALPAKYGYSIAGVGVAGSLEGKSVFVMHPHQEVLRVDDSSAVVLPDHIPLARATLFPNLETALNAVWDSELENGEKAAVVGAGPIGLLTAFAACAETGCPVDIIEHDDDRRAFAADLPWVGRVLSVERAALGAHDLVWHASGNPSGLQLSIDLLAFEGRVIEMSWYGDQPVALDLGGSFHWDRKRIIVSQVGRVAPSHRDAGPMGRTTRVLELLGDSELDAMLTDPIPFASLPTLMAAVRSGDGPYPHPIVDYGPPALESP